MTPQGKKVYSNNQMTVWGVFLKNRNRALAVAEVETILSVTEGVPKDMDVEDAFVELEVGGVIRECPDELHVIVLNSDLMEDTDKTELLDTVEQVRYRLVVARIV